MTDSDGRSIDKMLLHGVFCTAFVAAATDMIPGVFHMERGWLGQGA